MSDLISRQAAVELAMKYCPDDDGAVQCEGDIRELLDELEILPSAQPDHTADIGKKAEGDCISRQAATSIPILPKEHRKIFKSIDDAFETGWNEALSCVNMLPAAQPATNCSEIPNSSDDTISRQAAIDALGALSDAMFKNIEKGATFPKKQWFDGMANAESIIKDLPSAQPERKQGKWIYGEHDVAMCNGYR